jgi:hypothetical protein
MQNFLKFFGGFLALFIVVGLLLDRDFEVSREITINATPQEIHGYVNDLNQWPSWSPWQILDPSVITKIGDISVGVGASQTWTGNGGGGSLTFTQSSESEGIVYDLLFDGDSSVFITEMRYQVNNDSTNVSWVMKGKMEPIIVGGYFAQIMDTLVGDNFFLGLSNLKKTVESNNSKAVQ